MKVKAELGRISETGARRCIEGGLAAGQIGCQFRKIERMVEFSDVVPYGEFRDAMEEARRQVRNLRKAFPRAKPEVVALEAKFKEWDKILDVRGFGNLAPSLVAKAKGDLDDMKGRLRRTFRDGLRGCGRPLATEGDAAQALDDYKFFLPKSEEGPKISGRKGRK